MNLGKFGRAQIAVYKIIALGNTRWCKDYATIDQRRSRLMSLRHHLQLMTSWFLRSIIRLSPSD